MSKFAILYVTRHGSTKKIAEHISAVIREIGNEVTLLNLRNLPKNFSINAFDAVIIGGAVYASGYSRKLSRFVKRHHLDLSNTTTSFFFSVSLSAASKNSQGKENAQRCVTQFLRMTDWNPQRTINIAGSLRYVDYNPLMRWVMKKIVSKEGGDTNTTKNYEYTDWDTVTEYAKQCSEDVRT